MPATEKIVGRQICDPTAALATLRQPAGAGDGVVIPEFSAARMFDAFSKNISPEIDVSFSELELRLPSRGGEFEKITGKGEAANFETTEQVVAALKKDPCVEQAEVSAPEKNQKFWPSRVQPDREYEVPTRGFAGGAVGGRKFRRKGRKVRWLV